MKRCIICASLLLFLISCVKNEELDGSKLDLANVKNFKINNVLVSVVPILTKSVEIETYEVYFNADGGQLETQLTISDRTDGGTTQVFYLLGTNEEIITVVTDSEDNIISVEPPQGADSDYITSDSFGGALKYFRNCVAKKWRSLSSYLADNPELGVAAMAGGHYVAGVFVITSTNDCLRDIL